MILELKDMINFQAKKVTELVPLDFCDVCQDLWEIALRGADKWDSNKTAPFKTFMWTRLTWAGLDMVRNYNNKKDRYPLEDHIRDAILNNVQYPFPVTFSCVFACLGSKKGSQFRLAETVLRDLIDPNKKPIDKDSKDGIDNDLMKRYEVSVRTLLRAKQAIKQSVREVSNER